MFVRYNRFKQATAAADFWDNGAAPSDGIMYWGSHNAQSITPKPSLGHGAEHPRRPQFVRRLAPRLHLWLRRHQAGPSGLFAEVTLKTGAPRIPRFDVQDFTSIGPNNGSTYKSNNVSYTLVGNLTKISGKHSMKFGGEWRTFGLGFAQFGSSPANFSFTRAMTQGPDPRVAGAGDGLASFLLGTGTSGAATHRIKPADLSRYYAIYAQDDYKINSKLTLNVGMRLELEGSNTERYDQQNVMDPFAKIRSPTRRASTCAASISSPATTNPLPSRHSRHRT